MEGERDGEYHKRNVYIIIYDTTQVFRCDEISHDDNRKMFEAVFEDNKGVSRICKPKDIQNNGQKKKDKQRSTKHYT